MRAQVMALVVSGSLALGACGAGEPKARDESNPPQSATAPRSRGCEDLPKAAELKKFLQGAPSQLTGVAASALEHAKPVTPSSDPLTDDRAPVEWMTDQMIVRYASDGGTGR